MRFFAWISLVLIGLAASAAAAGFNGDWTGVWIKDGDSLPVTVHFKAAPQGETGSFDSDALQVTDIPFAEVKHDGVKVHWVLRSDSGASVFDGTLQNGFLDGVFVEDGKTGQFHLTRQAVTETAIESEDVTFTHDGITLAGSILHPAGKPGQRPGIVFTHGSGPEGRWASRYLATLFAKAGYVALITDKRGVGGSSGDWKSAGLFDFADDAVAGIALLRARTDVDPARVGIYGHSQGGWVAPLAAARDPKIAFVIASSAGGISLADTEEYSIANSLDVKHLDAAEAAEARAFARAIVDTGYRGQPYARLTVAVTRFAKRPWYWDPPPADSYYWAFARRLASFDPPSVWRQVKVPVLLLYGEDDERVPAGPSRTAITVALKAGGNERVTVKVFAHADHNFRLNNSAGWPKRAPGYAAALIGWAKDR